VPPQFGEQPGGAAAAAFQRHEQRAAIHPRAGEPVGGLGRQGGLDPIPFK
jgi:hypothetical protein